MRRPECAHICSSQMHATLEEERWGNVRTMWGVCAPEMGGREMRKSDNPSPPLDRHLKRKADDDRHLKRPPPNKTPVLRGQQRPYCTVGEDVCPFLDDLPSDVPCDWVEESAPAVALE